MGIFENKLIIETYFLILYLKFARNGLRKQLIFSFPDLNIKKDRKEKNLI